MLQLIGRQSIYRCPLSLHLTKWNVCEHDLRVHVCRAGKYILRRVDMRQITHQPSRSNSDRKTPCAGPSCCSIHNAWQSSWVHSRLIHKEQIDQCLYKTLSSRGRSSAQIRHTTKPWRLRRWALRLRKTSGNLPINLRVIIKAWIVKASSGWLLYMYAHPFALSWDGMM